MDIVSFPFVIFMHHPPGCNSKWTWLGVFLDNLCPCRFRFPKDVESDVASVAALRHDLQQRDEISKGSPRRSVHVPLLSQVKGESLGVSVIWHEQIKTWKNPGCEEPSQCFSSCKSDQKGERMAGLRCPCRHTAFIRSWWLSCFRHNNMNLWDAWRGQKQHSSEEAVWMPCQWNVSSTQEWRGACCAGSCQFHARYGSDKPTVTPQLHTSYTSII